MAVIAIDAACQTVVDFLGQQVGLVCDDEILLDGSGTDALLLPEVPVNRVTVVIINDEDTALEEGTDWRLGDGGILYRMPSSSCLWQSPVWPLGRATVRITYDHGWATTEDEVAGSDQGSGGSGSGSGSGASSCTAPAIPDSLRLVALSLASRIYAAGAIGITALGGIQSETIGDYSYSLGSASSTSNATDLSNLEKLVLMSYRVRFGIPHYRP